MRLFLIRHGETVDNVASLYAGSRDSALTNHGVLQCRRLAEHISSVLNPVNGEATSAGKPDEIADTPTVHLFSSNLQRAVKTAEAIRDALKITTAAVQQCPELREKHFGTGEGQSFATGVKKDVPHIGAESPAAMGARADAFLDAHILPLLVGDEDSTVVIVAHGIILSVLYRRLCQRITSSPSYGPEVRRDASREVTPSWSNTGYLEATLTPTSQEAGWASTKLHVLRMNATEHLKGLRKTRGGIGSARFDSKQKTMESFFSKKRKREDAAEKPPN